MIFTYPITTSKLSLRFFLILGFVIFSLLQPLSIFALSISNLEQQINIIDGEFSTPNGSDSPTNNSLGLIYFDSADYSGDDVYFEAIVRCDSCTGTGNHRVSVSLYNDQGSQITTPLTTTSSTYTRLRTASLSLSADEYTVRFHRDDDAGTAYLKAARLVIDQNATPLTDTQTQIEVGAYENSTSTSATSLIDPKYYSYDDSQYSGTTNAYFEATLRTDANSTNQTDFFNSYDSGGEEWTTNPSQMTDNNTSNYASTSSDGDVQLLTGNTNSGTDLGTITQVEARVYAYQNNDTTGTITLRPVFGGFSDGNDHDITPPVNTGAWSSYQDITTDTNAPSSWDWSDVQNLDLDVVWNQNAGSNSGFASKVEIRVTYEDNTILAYAELYNRTNTATVGNSTLSNFSNSYQRVRSDALTTNWDTSNPDEYEVRIYTSNAANAVYLSNAKIILDQTDAAGISNVEIIHLYANTARSQNNTSYVQESYYNLFAPYNFSGSNLFEAYFEATMKTSGDTGYAALYDYTGTDTIDTPTTSILTTTSTSYERQTSADLAQNSDWPTVASQLDTILAASSGETTTITNSWLIIRHGAIDPSLTFTIEGIAADQTNNGVTSSVETTISTIPFGNIAFSTPKYATHKLTIGTSDSATAVSVYANLESQLQGNYPANHIDEFIGSGAAWDDPKSWTSPTGSVPNNDTGWFGANTSDTDVSGWSGGSGLFGPFGTTAVEVLSSPSGTGETVYVSYAIEVNVLQPADYYTSTIIYNVLPTF